MQLKWKRPDGTFVAEIDGSDYHIIPDDPLAPDGLWSWAMGEASLLADNLPFEPVPPPPTPEEVLASIRAAATIDRETLCRALRSQGKLSDESAVEATAGRWPVEFDAVIQGVTPEQVWDAKVAWAGANIVRYQNPLLQAAALAFCQGDVAAATALLDQLFGIGGMT